MRQPRSKKDLQPGHAVEIVGDLRQRLTGYSDEEMEDAQARIFAIVMDLHTDASFIYVRAVAVSEDWMGAGSMEVERFTGIEDSEDTPAKNVRLIDAETRRDLGEELYAEIMCDGIATRTGLGYYTEPGVGPGMMELARAIGVDVDEAHEDYLNELMVD